MMMTTTPRPLNHPVHTKPLLAPSSRWQLPSAATPQPPQVPRLVPSLPSGKCPCSTLGASCLMSSSEQWQLCVTGRKRLQLRARSCCVVFASLRIDSATA